MRDCTGGPGASPRHLPAQLFPPRMKAGSFSLEKVMDQLAKESGSGK
jgi:hypothetical protein